MQIPVFKSVTATPDTVQTDADSELKATASPDEALAVTVNGDADRLRPPSAAKAMVCAALATAKERVTCAARA